MSKIDLKLCPSLVAFALSILIVATTPAHSSEPPKRIVFAGDTAYPPFEWLDGGVPKGYNVDLAQALADLSGTHLEYKLGPWPATMRALETGEVDVVAMFVSPEREDDFAFTSPFYYVDHGIYALSDTPPVYAVNELTQKRVAVEERSFAERQLAIEEIGAVTVPTANTVEALMAVEHGKAEYAILAAPIADRLIQGRNLSLKRLGPPFWPRGYAFAVREDHVEVRDWLQQTLELAISTGVYQDVYESWREELSSSTQSSAALSRAVLVALAALAAVVAIAVGWSWTLRQKVHSQTGHLRYALRKMRRAELEARHLASFDTGTGLAKPHHFVSLVDEMLNATKPPAEPKELLIMQLVDLNELVGTFGKSYSEELTRQFAEQLRGSCEGPCAYFGRAVFAACVDTSNTGKLLDSLSVHKHGDSSYVHFVCGSARFPEHGITSKELIRSGETALAIALSVRERWVVYNPAMEPDPANRAIISAFQDDHIEGLYSVFQPQIDIKSGKPVAAEALVRWNHPVLGFIGPEKFIPLIEKAGQIHKVTKMMIDEAVRLSARLRRLDQPIVISVNIAVYDLMATDLPQVVEDALKRHDGRAEDLKLELTETSFASDCGQTRVVLEQLSQMGVFTSIDDFGTGYSSLFYLSIFPIQEIKIDRAFVVDMSSNERHRGIVQSTILLADQLGLQSVAEGAEDEIAVQMLKEYGCDRVQGYFYSKPLPESQFVEFIRSSSCRADSNLGGEPRDSGE